MTRLSKFIAIILCSTFTTFTVASAVELPEVKITDTKVGDGDEAVMGARVMVHYTGWTLDGKQFDTSRDSDTPFKFSVGAREVIKGWDIGIQGMRVGGKRELIIPAVLAYGERGYPGSIPPNSVLKFEIELLDVRFNEYTNVNNDELFKLLERGVPVIDLRRPAEWESTGVIKGSQLVTAFRKNQGFITNFMRSLLKTHKKTDEFVLIGSNGRRTMYLVRILSDRKGYTSIFNVQKGINSWIKAGGAVVAYEAKEEVTQ
ncbi:MAG: peptidylprolyl isomerase [Rhodospirillaceae bacterium]|nr:MAG: peptidylprolyl isomerase [Rhodospirillaceae bacterium]